MCPYLESDDPRCGDHLNLYNLARALDHCACHYRQCPMFRRISQDAQAAARQFDQRHALAAS